MLAAMRAGLGLGARSMGGGARASAFPSMARTYSSAAMASVHLARFSDTQSKCVASLGAGSHASDRGAHVEQGRNTMSSTLQQLWGSRSRSYVTEADKKRLEKLRNIGISAHIDSGKTTLTERILFYTGRINEIHEVRGKDGVGAKMDSMELEREKGITIQSAATYTSWGDTMINIIDTPGHVDFTIEVERALRVLDGAVLVVCAVGGVQSQTMTVDRQMKRYDIPRIIFINKLDRSGADPWKGIDDIKSKLNLNAAAIQIPIGSESTLAGLVDLVRQKAVFYEGDHGEILRDAPIPAEMADMVAEKRHEMIMALAMADDDLGEKVMMDEDYSPSEEELMAAIRRATCARTFCPVMMGSAYKNKGVQQLLDGVVHYLPNPMEVTNKAFVQKAITSLADIPAESEPEQEIILESDSEKPFVGLAFKLEENRYGQLTYMRVYQGTLERGKFITNVNDRQKLKLPRLVRMHSNELEEVQSLGAGEIGAMFGVDCASGNTFTDGSSNVTMESMHVPESVISLSVAPKSKQDKNFMKALARFQREDPTFRVTHDADSNETIISGMGELHLDIYVERLKREYNCEAVTGKPRVAFRETISSEATFDYTHKKQSGGRGQYAKVIGSVEPLDETDDDGINTAVEFVDDTFGGSIPPEYMNAVEKGMHDALEKGPLIGHPVIGLRARVNDGAYHAVDSSEMAFRICTRYAVHQGILNAAPIIVEPIMKVNVDIPAEFQGAVIGNLTRRKGQIVNTSTLGDVCSIECTVPLNNMFGYSTELRSTTQGKGEFTMEYTKHVPCARDVQEKLVQEYTKDNASGN